MGPIAESDMMAHYAAVSIEAWRQAVSRRTWYEGCLDFCHAKCCFPGRIGNGTNERNKQLVDEMAGLNRPDHSQAAS